MDWNNRWIYKGSKTVPPCEQYVYWNIFSTVFPISEERLANYKSKIEKLNIGTGSQGNYREISKGTNLEVEYVRSGAAELVAAGALGLGSVVISMF